jgi:prepilin-type N-terminal cleavage/methylation domain-containing protein
MGLQRRKTRRGRAFTLIELLVVIALITLLIGLLLPTLSKARAQSSQLQCATILRNWGQAFQIYANDYKGFIPHCGDESRNPYAFLFQNDPAYPQNECCYVDVLPPLMHRPAWSSYPMGKRPTSDIWQCPLAQALIGAPYDYDPVADGYHSYCMNTYLEFDSLLIPVGTQRESSFLNLAKAKWPSETLLMFETTLNPLMTDGGLTPASPDCYCGLYPDATPADLGDRHPHQRGRLGGNLMMLDGHIEWTDHLWDPTLPIPSRPPLTNHMWWPY